MSVSFRELDGVFGIRASRATPPGLAAKGERRAVYGAALAQFEELLAASRQATPQTRPLSLFYALSQAGRAIAAAHSPKHWRLHGHGLSAPELDTANLLDVLVRPNPNKKESQPDSFSGVAGASASEALKEPVSIGELWATLPELATLLCETRWAEPLIVVADEPGVSNLFNWERVSAVVAPLEADSPEEAERRLAAYPSGQSANLHQPQGLPLVGELTPYGQGIRVWWTAASPDLSGQRRKLDEVAPLDLRSNLRWLRPALADGSLPSPLLTWWALLFALSMLARYEPAGWEAALDYDSSPLAAPLAHLLEVGVVLIPELVLEALVGNDVA